ncbi:MAG: M48 family metalloprotease [Thermoproteota archaeon]
MIPIELNYIVMQFFQPYFYYSTTLLIVSFFCIKALAKYNHFLTTRIRSLCYLLPLTIPALLIALTPYLLTMGFFFISPLSHNLRNTSLLVLLNPDTAPPLPTIFSHFKLIGVPSVTRLIGVPPITSILYAVGLTLSLLYLAVTIILGDRILKRVFHIVELEPSEYESLQRKVKELSWKLGIEPPRIGLAEDLRPNAFTIGYGRRTMLVFSLGILKTLKEKELAAVAAHELAHVKNHDFLFKTLSTTLTLLSFFNPFAYFASVTAQREREILADEDGTRVLGHPSLLAKTLIKIHEASRLFPKESFTVRLTSGLFLSSPVSMGSSLLSTHPKLDQRVENIKRLCSRDKPVHSNPLVPIVISILIIAVGVVSTYYLASIQSSFVRQYLPAMPFRMFPSGKGLSLTPSLDRFKNMRAPSYLKLRLKSLTLFKLWENEDSPIYLLVFNRN